MVTTRRSKAAGESTPTQAAASTPEPKTTKKTVEVADGWRGGDGTGAAVRGNTFVEKLLSHIGVLGLILVTPPTVIVLWWIHTTHGGDALALWNHFATKGFFQGLAIIWPAPTMKAWQIIGGFAAVEATMQVLVPGKTFLGPVTAMGNRPVYKANGVQCYLLTGVIFAVTWKLGWFDPCEVYDHFGEILSALNLASLGFCLFLLVKGHIAPSSTDAGSSGSPLFDFYWGMELYPRIGPLDLKTFTNCRFGMMAWSYLILCFAAKQHQLYGEVADSMIVSAVILLSYMTKFYMWETGYWNSMDIMHDRAGYYICWGCLVWVPCVYTSPSLYLTTHPVHLGLPLSLAIAAAGCACVYINYDSDRQRQNFRATNGKALVWGKPPRMIKAQYTTSTGETKKSILLSSGWWGIARHFHYLPEIMASFFWTVPGLFNHAIHYFYVVYLTILLFDRAVRDDVRCSGKYGKYWKEYQAQVPYRVLPGVF